MLALDGAHDRAALLSYIGEWGRTHGMILEHKAAADIYACSRPGVRCRGLTVRSRSRWQPCQCQCGQPEPNRTSLHDRVAPVAKQSSLRRARLQRLLHPAIAGRNQTAIATQVPPLLGGCILARRFWSKARKKPQGLSLARRRRGPSLERRRISPKSTPSKCWSCPRVWCRSAGLRWPWEGRGAC